MVTLITGASGHVGTNLLQELKKTQRRLRVLQQPGTSLANADGIEVIEGDIRDYNTMLKACQDVDVVFHLAAMISITGDRGGLVRDINVNGLRMTAKAALKQGVRRFVHTSSIHAFDINQSPDLLVDENTSRPSPHHPAYDRSKAEAEVELRHFIDLGLDAVIVNPTGIIGPGDPGNSRMGRLLLRFFHNQMKFVIDTGFDWVDVRDVVQGMLAAEARGRRGENYILSGHWHSLPQLATMIGQATQRPITCYRVPTWTAHLGVPFFHLLSRMQGVEPLCTKESLHAVRATKHISRAKAARELDFQPRPTQETINDLHLDFLKRQWLQPRAAVRASTNLAVEP